MTASPKEIDAGPAYAKFSLTLSSGWREEAAGPLFYSQESEGQQQWALPPFFCQTRTAVVDWEEWEIFYPLIDYRRFGSESRLEVGQLLSFSGEKSAEAEQVRHTTLFPFFFRQSSTNTDLNYTAVVPFYGHLKNRLFRDEIYFILFPLYSETRKNDLVTDNYLYPVFDRRRGDQTSGWQVWPLAGAEHKTPTLRTNAAGTVETAGGYEKFFALWPLYFESRLGLGTTNPADSLSIVPFFSQTRSVLRDQTSYGWPFGYTVIDDREKQYSERDLFWPFFVQARGSKTVHRFFPLYSQAHNQDLESDFYAWPIYKFNRLHSPPLERRRTRLLFFLYSDTVEENTQTAQSRRQVDLWPFFSFHGEPDGNRQWQALAMLEPFFPNNRSIRREYAPLWTVWRSERNPRTAASSQSLLWNLYRREKTGASKKTSLLFGLFQYQSMANGGRWRVCYVPLGKKPALPAQPHS